jgi:hypothetical protein
VAGFASLGTENAASFFTLASAGSTFFMHAETSELLNEPVVPLPVPPPELEHAATGMTAATATAAPNHLALRRRGPPGGGPEACDRRVLPNRLIIVGLP